MHDKATLFFFLEGMPLIELLTSPYKAMNYQCVFLFLSEVQDGILNIARLRDYNFYVMEISFLDVQAF
jgi:hypothetical protein